MTGSAPTFPAPEFKEPIIAIVGGYGSGKSEVAVNLSHLLVQSQPEPVTIADLDIVNPYFRSREAASQLDKLGIRSIVPEGSLHYADLPIILPQIKGAIENRDGKLVLDVGGDDVGARVLSSLHDAFEKGGYEMLLVINANRPFTSDVAGCMKMLNDIEKSSRLKFTGIISNTHLMEYTTPDTIMDGYRLTQEVATKTKLPIVFLSAMSEIVTGVEPGLIDVPVLLLDRYLLKPWERS
ncbi:MAG: cobalamin biosynthesis protein CbiA [candidate division Zixibacteria bacterium]|nr:cobalamin biosynthesis protein CbiA [candidate division Zixibacteria bacterium]